MLALGYGIVLRYGKIAACYHMARYFEKKGDFKQAIALFQQASAISNARSGTILSNLTHARRSCDHSVSQGMVSAIKTGHRDLLIRSVKLV
jgi:hypothetical protein